MHITKTNHKIVIYYDNKDFAVFTYLNYHFQGGYYLWKGTVYHTQYREQYTNLHVDELINQPTIHVQGQSLNQSIDELNLINKLQLVKLINPTKSIS